MCTLSVFLEAGVRDGSGWKIGQGHYRGEAA